MLCRVRCNDLSAGNVARISQARRPSRRELPSLRLCRCGSDESDSSPRSVQSACGIFSATRACNDAMSRKPSSPSGECRSESRSRLVREPMIDASRFRRCPQKRATANLFHTRNKFPNRLATDRFISVNRVGRPGVYAANLFPAHRAALENLFTKVTTCQHIHASDCVIRVL